MKLATTQRFLPYGRQSIDDDDIRAVVDVLRGDWLTTGPMVSRLEEALTAACGCADMVVVANGTAALHLALLGLGIGEGGAVVVPSVTFVATANAARFVGAEVVFADVDPVTGLMTEATCREAIARATLPVKAIMPVHLGGRFVELAPIRAIADEVGAVVVEDACHAIGGTDGSGRPAGACVESHAATFSFHPVKTITSGEGGAIACGTRELGDRLRQLRNHGLERRPGKWADPAMGLDQGEPNPWYYEMPVIGWNYRLTDMQCALALSQLGRLKSFVDRRRALADLYDAALKPLADTAKPIPRLAKQNGGWHLYQVAVDFAKLKRSRAAVMNALLASGVGTQVHYIPVHLQPYYRARYGRQMLRGAEAFYAGTLSLPLFPAMQKDDVQRVAESLKAALA